MQRPNGKNKGPMKEEENIENQGLSTKRIIIPPKKLEDYVVNLATNAENL